MDDVTASAAFSRTLVASKVQPNSAARRSTRQRGSFRLRRAGSLLFTVGGVDLVRALRFKESGGNAVFKRVEINKRSLI